MYIHFGLIKNLAKIYSRFKLSRKFSRAHQKRRLDSLIFHDEKCLRGFCQRFDIQMNHIIIFNKNWIRDRIDSFFSCVSCCALLLSNHADASTPCNVEFQVGVGEMIYLLIKADVMFNNIHYPQIPLLFGVENDINSEFTHTRYETMMLGVVFSVVITFNDVIRCFSSRRH